MADRVRPYLFYDVAVSICSTCYQKVEGKIVFQDASVYMLKRAQRTDPNACSWPTTWTTTGGAARCSSSRRRCLRCSTPPSSGAVRTTAGCAPIISSTRASLSSRSPITATCECPICYADSGPSRPQYRTLDHVQRLIDAVVRNEGEPDVVQISGGEPTIHPDFFAILDRAKAAPIRHLMVNTNGIRIAQDEAFAERLAEYMPDFEIYLQFDSFERAALMALRGADLRDVHLRALERLNRLGISTTLVVTLKKGLNDDEIGRIIDFALTQPAVRGVTFQPIQAAGRLEQFDPATDRLTLTEVRRKILEQTTVFRPEDVLPVPCHPDSLAMAYALKLDGRVVPLTGLIDPKVLIEGGRNTIVYEQDDAVRAGVFKLFATNHSPESGAGSLRDLLCCLPRVDAPATLGYQNIFRVLIMQFIDAYSFDVRSVKKTCVHIVHPDGRLIPFDTYNLFYRDGLEHTRLAPLRARAELSMKGSSA